MLEMLEMTSGAPKNAGKLVTSNVESSNNKRFSLLIGPNDVGYDVA